MVIQALTGALAYLAGQACNLVFQLLLLRALGPQTYGHVGLAHISLTALLFISDLGYSLYFLREKPTTVHWLGTWRSALGHRLVASLLLFSALAAFWIDHFGGADAGWIYLLAAAPAIPAALVNFSAPLLAAGRHNAGFAMQQIAWPAAAVCLVVTWPLQGPTLPQAALAGGCVSVGYLVQALFNLAAMRRFSRKTETGFRLCALLIPDFSLNGLRSLKASLALSMLGFLGISNDRLTAFLIENAAIDFLSAYLLLGQMLAGASGMLGQFNRLLVAGENNDRGTAALGALAALLLAPSTLLLLAITATCDGGCGKVPADWLRLGLPVLLDWILSAIGGSMTALLIGRHQEKKALRIIFTGITFSILAQIAGARLGSADAVLWARVAGATLGLSAAARLSGMAVPVSLPLFGLATALGSMSQAQLLPWQAPATASLIALAAILIQNAAPIRQSFSTPQPGEEGRDRLTAAEWAAIPENLSLQTEAISKAALHENNKPETSGPCAD